MTVTQEEAARDRRQGKLTFAKRVKESRAEGQGEGLDEVMEGTGG